MIRGSSLAQGFGAGLKCLSKINLFLRIYTRIYCSSAAASSSLPFCAVEADRSLMARTRGGETSLHQAMVEPSTRSPDIVVLDSVDEDKKFKEVADPKKDLWLSTVDGQVFFFRNKVGGSDPIKISVSMAVSRLHNVFPSLTSYYMSHKLSSIEPSSIANMLGNSDDINLPLYQ